MTPPCPEPSGGRTAPGARGRAAQPAGGRMPPLPSPAGRPGLAPIRVDLDLHALDARLAAEVRALCYHHKLVVFTDQRLSTDEYIAAARLLGTPQPYFQKHYHHPKHPEIFVSSNVPLDGQKVGVAGTGRMWHADYSFFERPLAFTCIYPQVLPASKRETYFIDMARVLADLPPRLRFAVEGLRFFHDAWDYYKVQPWDIDRALAEIIDDWHKEAPGASHPAVVTHPVTGERILFYSKGFTKRVEGIPYEQGQALLAELAEFVAQPKYKHCQEWREGDLYMWDNRSLIHHASTVPKGQSSMSYRISLYDELPFSA